MSGDDENLFPGGVSREDVARILIHHKPQILRRITGRLSPNIRSLFDTHEIMSTVLRRMDSYVAGGQLKVDSDRQFWALVQRIISNAIVDKARIVKRLRAVESEDEVIAALMLRCVGDSPDSETRLRDLIARINIIITNPEDQDIVMMWLKGKSLSVIAETFDVTPDAMRQRWKRIRDRLQEHLDNGA